MTILFIVSLVGGTRIARADDVVLHDTVGQEARSPVPASGGALTTVHGLYPLWEHTGVVAKSGGFQIGYNHAHVAYGRAQLSTQPFLDIYGTLNLQAKVALISSERFKLALVAGIYRSPTNAESRMLGKLNPTGFVNPYGAVYIAPFSVAKSLALGSRWAFHWASTVLFVQGDDASTRSVSAGQALLIEALASRSWRARLHVGVEGLRVQGQGHAALSFAYVAGHIFAAAGAGQRLTFKAERSTFLVFDAGLVF